MSAPRAGNALQSSLLSALRHGQVVSRRGSNAGVGQAALAATNPTTLGVGAPTPTPGPHVNSQDSAELKPKQSVSAAARATLRTKQNIPNNGSKQILASVLQPPNQISDTVQKRGYAGSSGMAFPENQNSGSAPSNRGFEIVLEADRKTNSPSLVPEAWALTLHKQLCQRQKPISSLPTTHENGHKKKGNDAKPEIGDVSDKQSFPTKPFLWHNTDKTQLGKNENHLKPEAKKLDKQSFPTKPFLWHNTDKTELEENENRLKEEAGDGVAKMASSWRSQLKNQIDEFDSSSSRPETYQEKLHTQIISKKPFVVPIIDQTGKTNEEADLPNTDAFRQQLLTDIEKVGLNGVAGGKEYVTVLISKFEQMNGQRHNLEIIAELKTFNESLEAFTNYITQPDAKKNANPQQVMVTKTLENAVKYMDSSVPSPDMPYNSTQKWRTLRLDDITHAVSALEEFMKQFGFPVSSKFATMAAKQLKNKIDETDQPEFYYSADINSNPWAGMREKMKEALENVRALCKSGGAGGGRRLAPLEPWCLETVQDGIDPLHVEKDALSSSPAPLQNYSSSQQTISQTFSPPSTDPLRSTIGQIATVVAVAGGSFLLWKFLKKFGGKVQTGDQDSSDTFTEEESVGEAGVKAEFSRAKNADD
eukprot:GHVT01069426.1.p1 GENE.GHVT01069426.1~~GHVT01069426.1.p1  ORF type:complete len:647 (+),score=113.87 GHVT01069426.1:291-2231(+)